jgi:hypothetical protein
MDLPRSDIGVILNGMLDSVLLLSSGEAGKSPEIDQEEHELMALILDLKTFNLMERLTPAWVASSMPKVGTVTRRDDQPPFIKSESCALYYQIQHIYFRISLDE